MIMVGPDLSVRRFTPQAMKVFGLNASDIGRPITRLRLNVEVDDFERILLEVMSEVRPSQHRVRDAAGELCDLRLTPYRTADNRIDGVVLSVLSFDHADEASGSRTANSRKSAAGKAKNRNSTAKKRK